MLKLLTRRRPSPATAISLVALFVALGGTTYAATGGNFILGNPNAATSQTSLSAPIAGRTLQVTNTSTAVGATALGLNVGAGRPPLFVNSATKVVSLNSDWLDGLDSSSFLRKGVNQTAAVSAAGGVVSVTNTGTTNGVQGLTAAGSASGVYGQNTSGGGFGIAGRAGTSGNAVYGDNTGTGYAGYFDDKVFFGGDLVCSGCVSASDIGAPVNDSDKLDGIDSTGFVRGAGEAGGQAVAVQPGVNLFLGPPLLGFLRLSYSCPGTLSDNGLLYIYNDSGSIANVFLESGTGNPAYAQLAAGGQIQHGASATGDSFHLQAHGALGVLTIEAATVNRSSDCHAQAQAVLTG